ncbi:MAG: hypothetical protein AAGJ46_18305 [Planctomycetota bacterium]
MIMIRQTPTLVLMLAALIAPGGVATAQLPIGDLLNKADNLKRLPDDNVEGVIWEYKGELERGELEGQKEGRIGGLFRMEDEGLYAVGGVIKLPGIQDIQKLLDDILKGAGREIRLPNFKPRRIGDFKQGRTGRLTLTFDDESNDPNALYGTMILRPKKRQTTVFIGDFQEKEGRKTVRTWQMTVRKVQD